jgi:hypothetical protein
MGGARLERATLRCIGSVKRLPAIVLMPLLSVDSEPAGAVNASSWSVGTRSFDRRSSNGGGGLVR